MKWLQFPAFIEILPELEDKLLIPITFVDTLNI